MAIKIATFGAGCFWCIEAAFGELNGVVSATSGYSGGHTPNPSYQAICQGDTAHAEVVQIQFDDSIVGYQQLLTVFFSLHDPTTLNRQGNDIGTQYRSVIFYHDQSQQQQALTMVDDLNEQAIFSHRIVTAVEPAATFYPAEGDHQHYVQNNPNNPYCVVVVAPKLLKFREKFASLLKAQ